MKKIVSIVLCFIILFSFAACAKTTSTTQASGSSSTKSASLDDTVKISIPIEMIDEEYQNDLDAYCEKYGYESAKLNKRNNTVTVVMNSFSHDLLLTQIGTQVIKTIYSVEDNDEYPYVNKIESYDKDNFSKVVLSVDGSSYTSGAMAPYIIGQSCLLYQLYAGADSYKCEVEVVDKETNEVIETKVYTDKDE